MVRSVGSSLPADSAAGRRSSLVRRLPGAEDKIAYAEVGMGSGDSPGEEERIAVGVGSSPLVEALAGCRDRRCWGRSWEEERDRLFGPFCWRFAVGGGGEEVVVVVCSAWIVP